MCFIASTTNDCLHLLKQNYCPYILMHHAFLSRFQDCYFTSVLYWFIIFSMVASMHLINKYFRHAYPCHSWSFGEKKIEKNIWTSLEAILYKTLHITTLWSTERFLSCNLMQQSTQTSLCVNNWHSHKMWNSQLVALTCVLLCQVSSTLNFPTCSNIHLLNVCHTIINI